ncbi:MAG: PD40 domain-containing protein [Anaerolineales bacterium]|nr:PD40 domain-containing protein [Anaerolineales bacterium]
MALLITAYLWGSTLQVQGQSNRLRKLSTTDFDYLEWAADSQSLVAIQGNSPSVIEEFMWSHYNIATNQFSDHSVYPYLPHLTPQENTIFVPASAKGSDGEIYYMSFSYLSPNGRYLVYVGEPTTELNHQYWRWLIGDRQTQTTFNSGKPVFQPFGKLESFNVTWNRDSTAFILTLCGDLYFCSPPAFVFVYGLNNGLSSFVVNDIKISFPMVENVQYRTFDLIDFSGDGQWALLRVSVAEKLALGEGGGSYLLMYNTQTPETSFFLSNGLLKGGGTLQFATIDGTSLLFIDNVGIQRYDWANDTIILLTTEVNNSIASYPRAFSPDGRWFVFVSGGVLKAGELYLYDLQGLPETPPSPTPPLPTAYPHPTGIPGGQPACPGGGGEWMWVDGELVFVCGVTWE